MDNLPMKELDRSNMFDVLKNFHHQVEDAVKIADGNSLEAFNVKGITNIILTGLGGSAIGGDYVRSYLTYDLKVPMLINRNYCLPEFANENTLVIISSYSGNTEETISAFKDALKKRCRIICVTGGGEIGKMAKQENIPVFSPPPGYQPRCAIGYSFFIVLKIMSALKFVSDRTEEINASIKLIAELSNVYSSMSSSSNTAYKIALSLKDKLPVIYSSADIMDTVNVRWRGQISENAKVLAYGSLFPEMNHNELVGWKLNPDLLKKIVVIFLEDEEDHARVKIRVDVVKGILKNYTDSIISLNGIGRSKLERMFELTYLGDWVSYYLAILNGVDPTPVDAINFLKEELSKH